MIDDNYKTIHDNLHKYIQISNFAVKFIDNPIFKRLQNLKQLGLAYKVFLGANHTRFEHSIGTYYLTGRLINTINERTNNYDMNKYLQEIRLLDNYYDRNDIKYRELDIYVKELIKIAGLCHDLGHGPFSHLFDDIIIPKLNDDPHIDKNLLKHEYRSCKLVELIWDNDPYLKENINYDEIKFIQSIINPPKDKQHFIYQIVSNNLNGLDVDKYDYINRDAYSLGMMEHTTDIYRLIDDIYVIDNKICYPKQAYMDILNLFNTRYNLHKHVYTHKTIVSIQYLVLELMKNLDEYLDISDSLFDMNKFIDLDDNIILNYVKSIKNYMEKNNIYIPDKIKYCNKIINDIDNRNFHKVLSSIISEKILKIKDNSFVKDNFIIHENSLGFTSSNSNPLNDIYFYDKKKTNKYNINNSCYNINLGDITYLIPYKIKEFLTIIYLKNDSEIEIDENNINDFIYKHIIDA